MSFLQYRQFTHGIAQNLTIRNVIKVACIYFTLMDRKLIIQQAALDKLTILSPIVMIPCEVHDLMISQDWLGVSEKKTSKLF